jgi:hypothetical protein
MATDKTNKTKKTPSRDDASHSSSASYPGFIPPHGGYEKLLAYKKAEIIYDATVRFCDRFIDKKSRTHDQMVQAARSGNKNIAEGSQISGTSMEGELKLTNVARALRRAGQAARKTARAHGTPIYILQDGKVVAQKP